MVFLNYEFIKKINLNILHYHNGFRMGFAENRSGYIYKNVDYDKAFNNIVLS